jgi:hypothetical protein
LPSFNGAKEAFLPVPLEWKWRGIGKQVPPLVGKKYGKPNLPLAIADSMELLESI